MRSVLVARAAFAVATFPALTAGAWAESAPVEPGRFDAMLERPLFSPTRRPPPPPPAPLAPPLAALPVLPSAAAPEVALSGVITGGGAGVALLRRPQDLVPVRVVLGGQIDGWTVTEIHPRAVVLRREASSVTVELPVASR